MTVKMNFSLDAGVAQTLKRRAQEQGKSASRYLSELVERDANTAREELAATGYRALALETRGFADDALPLAAETWPGWEEQR